MFGLIYHVCGFHEPSHIVDHPHHYQILSAPPLLFMWVRWCGLLMAGWPNYEKFYVQTHQLRSSILPEGKFFSYLLFTPLTSLWHCLMYEVSVSYRRRAFALKDTLSNLSYAKDRVITYVSSKDFTIRSLSNPILLDNPKRCIFLWV